MKARQLFAELMRSQMMTPQQLQQVQRRHLANLVAFVHRTMPFYRSRLAPLIAGGQTVDLDRWLDVPTLDRATVQANAEALMAVTVPPHAGPGADKSTSGSSGRVLRLRRSELASQFDTALTQRAYTWWKLDPRATQVSILTFGEGTEDHLRPEGHHDWHFADPSGRAFAMQASEPPADQARFLRERAADYLISQPSMAAAVADSVLRSGLPLKLRGVLALGETVHPEQRDLFRQAFGARTYDTYGSVELGHIAAECPVCGLYHVNAESVLLEVLDERGQPVGPGQTGRAVLTSLHNFAMPFIRYDIGDYITRAPRGNRCKRGLPSIAAIVGRETELFVTRAGEQFFPSIQARLVADYLGLSEIQFVQTDYEMMEIRYVPAPSDAPDRPAELIALVKAKIGHGIEVKLVPVAEIPRLRGAKQIMKLSQVPRPPRS